MSATSPSPPRLWRSRGPVPPGANRRAVLRAVLLSVAILVVAGIGLLYLLAPAREAAVLPVAITSAPWGEQDRAATSHLFGRPMDMSVNPGRDEIRLRFAALASLPRSQPLVIHLAAPALVDGTGNVYLLPADEVGDSPSNHLTLVELLSAVRDSPSRHKLLILNLTPPHEDALFAADPGNLSAAIFAALESVPDETRLTLVACVAGQVAFASPELGRSVFSYYLEAGLNGAADGDRDGRISVKELAAFVRTRVARWTKQNRGEVQTPTLVGSAPDFRLRAYIPTPAADELQVQEIAYPDWLKAAWEEQVKQPASHWAGREAHRALLAAERDLRSGRAAEEVKRSLEVRLMEVRRLSAELQAVPTPEPLPTLAAVFPGYALPDAGLVEQLRTTVIAIEAKPVTPGEPGTKATEPRLPPELDALKAKPHPQLAAAAFLVLADDVDVSPGRVKLFARLLAAQEPQVRFAEVLLIRRLAALADQQSLAPWSGERAALALQTARMLEENATRLVVIAHARPALDEAYRLRANAEAVLFAPGFASPEDATIRLRTAVAAARRLKSASDRLLAALAVRDNAILWLAAASPLVNSGIVDAADAIAAAEAVAKVNDALPQANQEYHLAEFAERVPDWDQLATAVQQAYNTANRPLSADALLALRKRAAASDAGPEVIARLDAVLETPLLPIAERVALWNARSAVARSLCESTLRADAADDLAFRTGTPRRSVDEPEVEAPYDAALAERRARWTAALLRLGGISAADVQPIERELLRRARDRYAFAEQLRQTWTDVPRMTVALAAIVPSSHATAVLDSQATNPGAVWARETARKLWEWQTERFEYEARDPADPGAAVNGVPFALAAAKACAAAANRSGFPYIAIAPLTSPRLTFEQPRAELQLKLRSIGAPARAEVRALSASTEWLEQAPAVGIALDPVRESLVTLPLHAGSEPTAHPSALGVLVEVDVEFGRSRRTFHRRVPVSLHTLANRVDLLVRTDPKAPPRPLSEFSIRPNNVPVGYQLMLCNPTPLPQRVIARLAGLNRETAPLVLEPGKPIPLVFATTAPPTPPPLPDAKPKTNDGFQPLDENELILELLDPADREIVLQTFRLPVVVPDPASYLRVSAAAFTPADDGKPNRLGITVVPGDIPGAAPCAVKMEFPAASNPGLIVRDGSQAGSVVAAGKPVTLYAENIAFPSSVGANVTVAVAADGVERVFTYFAVLPTLGETVRLQAVTNPRIRVNAPAFAPGNTPLPVTLEVDHPPTGAKIELLVGTAKDDSTALAADLTLPIASARARSAKYRFDAKGESLDLAGSLADHKPVLPVELLTGRRAIEARLFSADGELIAKHRVYVVFDGRAPGEVQFIDLPARAAKGQPLPVKATCAPSISGIKEVRFFIGKPVQDQLPAAPLPVAGVLFEGSEWRATLQMPDTAGIVVIGVQFTTNAGLSTIETQEIELMDAAELNRPAPGKIVGILSENRIPQPAATIFLYDAKGNPLAKAVTQANGSYEFKNVPPGAYFLFSEKVATNRQVKEQVEVKPGDTVEKDLQLLLK